MKKTFFTICIISTALASVTRYIAYTYCFDGTFFTDNDLFAWITILLCVLPCIYPLFMYYLKRDLQSSFRYIVDTNTKVISFFMAIFASFGGYVMYGIYVENDLADSALIQSVSLIEPFFILTIAMCAYLIIMSLLQISDNIDVFRKIKFMELIPIIWSIMLIVYLYIYYASSLRVTEDVIAVIGSASLILAFLNRGKIIVGMDEKRNCYKKMLIHSSIAFTMWISLFVSDLALGSTVVSYEMYIPFEIVFMCSVMSGLLFVFCAGDNFVHKLQDKIKPIPRHYK